MTQKKAPAKKVPTKKAPARKAPVKVKSRTRSVASRTLQLPHETIARTAYFLWEHRGLPFGSAEVDWYKAIDELQRG